MADAINSIRMIAMGCKPDPTNFTILRLEHIGNCTIILAEYHGCKTFSGHKLMLLRGIHKAEDFETLDPHFLDEEYAVIGRFIPNDLGLKMARVAAQYFSANAIPRSAKITTGAYAILDGGKFARYGGATEERAKDILWEMKNEDPTYKDSNLSIKWLSFEEMNKSNS